MEELSTGIWENGRESAVISNSLIKEAGCHLLVKTQTNFAYPYSLRCLTDLSLCKDALYLSVWLKLDQQMVRRHKIRAILSSGGHTDEVDSGGIAVWIKNTKLNVDVRTRNPPREWIYNSTEAPPVHTWFHLSVTWTPGGDLKVYLDGNLEGSSISGQPFHPLNKNAPRHMMIGRLNNVDSADFYGEFEV